MEIVEPPRSALLASGLSPAFDAPPPFRWHGERMRDDIVAACGAQTQGHFPARRFRMWLLRDVFVAWEGLVFDHDGHVLRPSITQHHPREIAWAASQLAAVRATADIACHTHPLVLGKKRGAMNYGHWLLEMLPMLHLAQARLRDSTIGALLHEVTDAQLGGVMQDSLRCIGIPDHLVRVSDAMPVRVERLILVEGLTEHGTYMSPLVVDAVAALRDSVVGTGHRRVFITRGADMRRDFEAPDRIEQLAREAGFHVMDPDGMTLSEQLARLRDAETVAGAMGAAMTNLVFAAPGARIAMFAGADMPDTFFWFAASLRGHRYEELRCAQSEQVQGLFYDRALLVPDEEAKRFLAG